MSDHIQRKMTTPSFAADVYFYMENKNYPSNLSTNIRDRASL